MKIIESYLGYCIIQSGNAYSVMSKYNTKECKFFNEENAYEQAKEYFNKLTNPMLVAQANAPSWD